LTPQLVQAVRDVAEVVELASEHTRLRRSGRGYLGLCPFHKEKTPSFHVDPDRNLFYCFGCSRGGDAITLHMQVTGDDFPGAIEALAGRYGIPLPRTRSGSDGERQVDEALQRAAEFFAASLEGSMLARSYLEQRAIPDEVISRYGLGYAPDGWRKLVEKLSRDFSPQVLLQSGLALTSRRRPDEILDRFRHRLMFPIRAASGRVVGFGGRTLGDDRAKYLNTSETGSFRKGHLLYGLDVARPAIREHGHAVLVEGYFDVLGAVSAGVTTAVACMGTALTAQQARLLARYTDDVVLAYDGDAAGQEAARRAMVVLLGERITARWATMPVGGDPDTLRLESGDEALQRAIEVASDAVEIELARLVPKGPLPPAAQAKAARSVAALLRSVSDPLLRHGYGKMGAERLALPLELLLQEVESGGRRETPQALPTETVTGSDVRSLEEAALHRILESLPKETGAPAVRSLPTPEELPDPELFLDGLCRNIYGVFRDLYGEAAGQPPAMPELLAALAETTGGVERVARILVGGKSSARPSSLSELLGRLYRRWQQQRLKALAREVREAESQGDKERLEELLREKTQLSQALHRPPS
jgi:DNA primase